jgi:hypothetical protein
LAYLELTVIFRGIVGAETILSIIRDEPIPMSGSTDKPQKNATDTTSFMFPSILGLLAFDTPYLGISPGVLAHNAETHYQNVRGAWSAYNSVAGALGLGASKPAKEAATVDASKALPAPPPAEDTADAAAVPAWQKWGRYAMYAGAAGAMLAGGAAAYANRNQLSEGWGWATSHLEFVGCLARGAQLEARVADIIELTEKRQLGFRNLYTQLGTGAGTLMWKDGEGSASGGGWAHQLTGAERTFCLLPKSENVKTFFEPAVNDKADSEISAHMWMFTPKDNPGYYVLSERAKETITEWVRNGWPIPETGPEPSGGSKIDEDPEIVYKEEVENAPVDEGNPWA